MCRLALPALNEAGARITVLRALPGPGRRAPRGRRTPRLRGRGERRGAAGALGAVPLRGLRARSRQGRARRGRDGERARGRLDALPAQALLHRIARRRGRRPRPGRPRRKPSRGPAPAAYALQQILVGLPRTAIYALLASAYALVFGLVGRINLAFGELAAIGAAATVAGVAIALALGATTPLAGLALGLLLSARGERASRRRRRPFRRRPGWGAPERAGLAHRHRRPLARADGIPAPGRRAR